MENQKSVSVKVFVVVPAFNEAGIIQEVLTEIQASGQHNIIVVDDGSTDSTFQKAKKVECVTVLRHKINRGKGAATKTGIEAAKLLGADAIVTMDADGQHDPGDIAAVVRPIVENKAEVALGTRSMQLHDMPFYAVIRNYVANFFTWWIYGLWVSDSQSGFRAYSRHAAEKINARGDRYEYESEIIREVYICHLKYAEVPINVQYTEYSTGKIHKQGLLNGLKTLYKIIWNTIS